MTDKFIAALIFQAVFWSGCLLGYYRGRRATHADLQRVSKSLAELFRIN